MNTPQTPSSSSLHSACSPKLCYTAEESEAANKEWRATCGPHSIAAACGLNLAAVRGAIPQPYKGWMSPTQITGTLVNLRRRYSLRTGLKTAELCNGINRIQWEGKWLNPGVPARIAYFHTHYVAHLDGWVLCTACINEQWLPVDLWRAFVAQAEKPFHVTHHWNLENVAGQATAKGEQ